MLVAPMSVKKTQKSMSVNGISGTACYWHMKSKAGIEQSMITICAPEYFDGLMQKDIILMR